MKIKGYQKSVPIQSKVNKYNSNKDVINSARKQEKECFKFLTFFNYPLPFQN
ncbi:hypothetical protein [Mycoplasma sp. 1654_15]|uniref:hypothetical protein n=1 Tax=Mycoplasma sp. 1654_15 TaxID=2725994 RepID=UPI001448B5B5|nr:hypothetical protein [Mycoplasma sp. 1654_15]QJB71230.1 hypothetical protein HF996_01895 [Mycoplasma sp. 1654_15]